MNSQKFIKKLLNKAPCDYFSFHRINPHEIVSSYPKAWLKHYEEQNYKSVDYPHLRSNSQLIPCYWGTEIYQETTKQQRQIFEEALEFNLYAGITIFSPVCDAFLTFAYNKSDSNVLKKHREFLEFRLIMYVYFLGYAHDQQDNENMEETLYFFKNFNRLIEKVLRWTHYGRAYLNIGRLFLSDTIYCEKKSMTQDNLYKSARYLEKVEDLFFKK